MKKAPRCQGKRRRSSRLREVPWVYVGRFGQRSGEPYRASARITAALVNGLPTHEPTRTTHAACPVLAADARCEIATVVAGIDATMGYHRENGEVIAATPRSTCTAASR